MKKSTVKFLAFTLLYFLYIAKVSAVTIEDVEAAWERDDSVAAISLLTELANETKDSEYQLTLAMSYKNGWDVEVDHVKAIKWFELAVEQNNPDAMALYADYYYYGRHIEKDLKKAKALLQRSVDMGSSVGQIEFGKYYYYGVEGDRDYITAKTWFDLAAKQNNSNVYFYLGALYFNDKKLEKNYVLAYKWLSLMSIYEEDKDSTVLEILKSKMTAEEMKKGDVLVKEWLAEHPKKEEPS